MKQDSYRSNDLRRAGGGLVSDATFESRQHMWTAALEQWLDRIGSTNVGNLRKVEISLGIWHLEKPVSKFIAL